MRRWECLTGHAARSDRDTETRECMICLAPMVLLEEL